MLRVGDMVLWRSSPALVEEIEVTDRGAKYGIGVDSVEFSDDGSFVVTLDNGHWAHDWQIEPLPDARSDAEVSA